MNKEKPPQFIKEFSKEESQEERQQAAEAIKAKRAEHFTEKRTQTERQAELQQVTSEREQTLAKQLESVRNLENEIAELSTLRLGKILNYFQLKKFRADISIGQKTYEELRQQQDIEITKKQVISGELESEETPPAFQEAKAMLSNFYKGQKEKWAKSEYTKEDITKFFSEENLSSLSLKDYALLLKRFPREMVTHVTRQGIRDHIGHMYHSAGVGAYTDSFMKMVEDGRLRSPLGVYLVEKEKEQAIAKFLRLENKSKKEALNYLDDLTKEEWKVGSSYMDKMAVHFATEEVVDCYYGSEKGNEIFITYLSAHIASQYYFNGRLSGGMDGVWNDQWVWANEERGMDLNAGLVFISEEAKVDKKTGSRYELDENKKAVKNFEYQAAFKRVVNSDDFYNFANQAIDIVGRLTQRWNDPDLLQKNRELLERLEPFRQRIEQKLGITDRRLQFAILDYNILSNFRFENQEEDEKVSSYSIEQALIKEGILYTEAKDTISSKEFWEAYFAKNPSKRPSKIVYYKGTDPTNALWQWRNEHGIDKKTDDKNLGFSERFVDRSAPQARVGLDRFKTLAEKVIDDYFDRK